MADPMRIGEFRPSLSPSPSPRLPNPSPNPNPNPNHLNPNPNPNHHHNPQIATAKSAIELLQAHELYLHSILERCMLLPRSAKVRAYHSNLI